MLFILRASAWFGHIAGALKADDSLIINNVKVEYCVLFRFLKRKIVCLVNELQKYLLEILNETHAYT